MKTLRLIVAIAVLCVLTQAPRAEESALLAAGPMPAWAEMTSNCVWLQTSRPCDVQLRYWKKDKPGTARLSPLVTTSVAGDHIALFELKQLTPGTRYGYEVYLDGELQKFDWPLEFQTQALWRWRGNAPDFTFTLGSCLYVNEAEMDRPGKPYGGDFELLDALAAERADFMLWLGDNTYLREPDWLTEAGIRHRYAHTRAFDKLQRVLATRHNYAIWDDHDYGPNDSDRSFRLKETALEVFSDYWPAPCYGTETTPGAFQRFEWADVEFFLLDDRYYRAPNKSKKGTMFGAEQLAWLKDALSNSLGTFKIIVGGGQMMNPIAPYEGFAQAPKERQELIDYIVKQKIEGVLFLSGDRHHTELIKITPEAGYPLYDFTCSPLSSGARTMRENDPEAENAWRVPGTLVTGARNYGRVAVSGEGANRKLTLSCRDKTGAELWQHAVHIEELRVAK
jgi:alkaline phosphatase D